MKKESDGYTDAEIEQRAADMIRRSFTLPRKKHRDLVGKTDRAKAMRRTKLKRAMEKADASKQEANLVLQDGDALQVMRELAALAEFGVDFRRELDQLLNEDPVTFICEQDTSTAVMANSYRTTVKASEGLRRLLATARAKKADIIAARATSVVHGNGD